MTRHSPQEPLISLAFFRSAKFILSFFTISAVILTLHSCKEEDESPAPVITQVSPAEAHVGTTITITGENFHADASGNIVKFNGVQAIVSNGSATSLTVDIPEGATTGPLTVTAHGKTATFSTFTVLAPAPVVKAFSPESGGAGTIVIITGENFNTVPAENTVIFNYGKAVVEEATATTLKVTVPANASTGKISVTTNAQTSVSETDFTLIPDIATIDPVLGAVSTIVTVTGTGFAIPAANNTVTINGTEAEVVSGTVQQLKVKVPEGATTGALMVTSGGHTAEGPAFEVVIEAVSAGGPNFESGFAIDVDVDGNTYVGGSFVGEMTFGSTVITGSLEDGFLAKYDADGKFIWVQQLTGTNSERIMDLAVDNAGNIYVAGYISSVDATLGSLTAPASSTDGFVARVNANGGPAWIKTFGGSNTDNLSSIDVDNASGVYVAGHFFETIKIGTTTLIATGDSDLVVAKYNADSGDPEWAASFGGASAEVSTGIAIDDQGMYVCGIFSDAFEMPGINPITSAGAFEGFAARLDLSGQPVWVQQIAGAGDDGALEVVADPAGNCIVGGYFTGSATVGDISLNPAGMEDGFLAKLAKDDGATIWAQTAGGNSYDRITAIATDNTGNIYAVGEYHRNATFGTITVESTHLHGDIFVATYNSNGIPDVVKDAGGPEHDFAQAVALSHEGVIHITGAFRFHNVVFGVTELQNTGGDDMFLWKIWP